MIKPALTLMLVSMQLALGYIEVPLQQRVSRSQLTHQLNLIETSEESLSTVERMAEEETREYYFEQILTNYQDFQYFGKLYMGSEQQEH